MAEETAEIPPAIYDVMLLKQFAQEAEVCLRVDFFNSWGSFILNDINMKFSHNAHIA